jgi:protein-S-isoprenylcysteine O-methyltransferase Ste14
MSVSYASSSIQAPRTNSWRRRLSYLQDALLIVSAALFLYAHGKTAIDMGENWHAVANAGFAAEQAMLVVMFLIRRRTRSTSTRWQDWVVAIGAWLPLLGRPADSSDTAATLGAAIQLIGLAAVCFSFSYMGRSFGVVAANRGLKVNGPYRIVRHPIYVGHAVTYLGFLVANPSPWNAAIFVVTGVCQLLRIRSEERWLTATSDYAAYREQVRWKLIPHVF